MSKYFSWGELPAAWTITKVHWINVIPVLRVDSVTIYQQALQYWDVSCDSHIECFCTPCSCNNAEWVRGATAHMHVHTHTHTHKHTHKPKYAASAMPRDLFTDLRVIDVGGARATYKIQNKGSVLSAYRKNITQDQTPKAQQQEQNRGMEKNVDGRRETRAKAPTPKHQQGEPFYPSIYGW